MTELNGFLPKGMHTLVHFLGDVAKSNVTLMQNFEYALGAIRQV